MTMQWLERAACAGMDTELWFPLDERQERVVAPARAVCADCPVRAECLAYALERDVVGVWGGATTAERRALRRDRAA